MIEALAASPELMEKIMADVAAQSASSTVAANGFPQMPSSIIGMQSPAGSVNAQPLAGSINPQAMQASLQGGAPEGFFTGNMQDPSAGVNNIPQELASMGYTPPPAAPAAQQPSMMDKIATAELQQIQHHPLVKSNAQYVPMPVSDFNPYAPTSGNMGLMELLAQAQQMG